MSIPVGTRGGKSGRASLALLLVTLVVVSLALVIVVPQRSVRRERRSPIVGMTEPERWAMGIKLDLNRATESELALLPGVGPALAKKLVDYRQRHGDFRSLDEAVAVEGIGAKRVDRWRAYATVNPPP